MITSNSPKKIDDVESLLVILLTFMKVGAFTFGGGYAMLPVIQKEVVEKHNWVDHKTFGDILIITQGLPGQLALNSSIQIGIKLRGIPGGITAALGVTAPSVLIILLIATILYPMLYDNVYFQAAFYGLRPAVLALIAAAAIKMGKKILFGLKGVVLCVFLLLSALLTGVHPIMIMIAGGILGLFICKENYKE